MTQTSSKPARARDATDTARLVKACVAGDEEAWRVLVDRYQAFVFAIVLRYGVERTDAQDVFQQVWVDAFNDLEKIREPKAFQGWLARVALHRCHHWQKRRRRENARFVDDASVPDPVGSHRPDWQEELEHQQLLRECVLRLPERCRRLVEMLFFEEPRRPYRRVAEELGLAVGSIGLTRSRCLERLRKLLLEVGIR